MTNGILSYIEKTSRRLIDENQLRTKTLLEESTIKRTSRA